MAVQTKETLVNNPTLLHVTSINTQGLKSNIVHVTNLLEQNDILFLSEHWLSNAEKSILTNINKHNTHQIFFTAAEKQAMGRPFGGNCFMIRSSLIQKKTVLHDDSNALAIRIQSTNFDVIFIGVYLTCYHDSPSKDEYTQQLNNISALVEMYTDESDFVIMGDFQTFPSNMYDNLARNNPKRNPLSPILEQFLGENDLACVDITKGQGPTHTYEHKTLNNKS